MRHNGAAHLLRRLTPTPWFQDDSLVVGLLMRLVFGCWLLIQSCVADPLMAP